MGHRRFRVTKHVDDTATVTGGEAYLCRNRMKTRVRDLSLCLQRGSYAHGLNLLQLLARRCVQNPQDGAHIDVRNGLIHG
jgi:hypothetical protein